MWLRSHKYLPHPPIRQTKDSAFASSKPPCRRVEVCDELMGGFFVSQFCSQIGSANTLIHLFLDPFPQTWIFSLITRVALSALVESSSNDWPFGSRFYLGSAVDTSRNSCGSLPFSRYLDWMRLILHTYLFTRHESQWQSRCSTC